MEIVILVLILIVVFSLCMSFRNFRVYEERIRVLNYASKKAKEAIDKGCDWEKEYEIADRYSYNEMMYKFWKPVKSFYKDIRYEKLF